MRVLIVTPTLGTSPWLDETVRSVAAFRETVRHVLVAPAGAVPGLRERHPGVEVRPEPGGGMYPAIKFVVDSAADWAFAGYLNDDDRLEPGFAAVLEAASSDSGDVLYGDVAYIDGRGRFLGRMPVAAPPAVSAVIASGRAAMTQQGALVSRALWRRLGGFDVRWRLAGDCDLWCRSVVAGARFARVRAIVASFRLHGGQLSADRSRMESEIAAVYREHATALAPHRNLAALAWFRLASLACVMERWRHAGVWTSRALYARHAAAP